MKKRRNKVVEMVLDWFSDYHETIITEEEAKEFIKRLPKAIKALQRIQEVIKRPRKS